MSINLPGHAPPPVGFEAPLEMLSACHARIEQQCATLQRLVQHVAVHGTDAQARSAAAGVMHYFDTAAVDHHADEEMDLFPALIEAMAGSDAVCLRELTAGLATEHRELESRWRQVREALAQVAVAATTSLDADAIAAFVGIYQRHIAREEGELLPMAARLLDDDALDRVGRAMRERRGVAPV